MNYVTLINKLDLSRAIYNEMYHLFMNKGCMLPLQAVADHHDIRHSINVFVFEKYIENIDTHNKKVDLMKS